MNILIINEYIDNKCSYFPKQRCSSIYLTFYFLKEQNMLKIHHVTSCHMMFLQPVSTEGEKCISKYAYKFISALLFRKKFY